MSGWSVHPKGSMSLHRPVFNSMHSCARMDRHTCVTSRPHHTHLLYFFRRTVVIPAIHTLENILVFSQVMSPTLLSRLAVRRFTTLLPSRKASIGSTYNSGADIVTIPPVSEVDERSNFGTAGLTTVFTGERQVQPHFVFITLVVKVPRQVHHTFLPVRRDPWRCVHTRENQIEIQISCRSLHQKEGGFFLSVETSAISLNYELIMLLREKKLLYQDSLMRNVVRDCFLRNKKRITKLSEVRSELNMQELRVESADRVLQGPVQQLCSQRMEFYQANQLSDHSKREKNWLCTELENRERVLQETRMRTLPGHGRIEKDLLH